ncbi:hypothetical protein LBMAG42_31990 [Deltaproteobacteria bacterium]|nr:hypothetical protein LBMAG42_31990 [Deltaproteobacteria bacterium]
MNELFLAAFVAGLMGSGHCVGMCGPFVVAAGPLWHVGRVGAYLIAGAVAGFGGRALPSGPWTGLLSAVVLVGACLRFGGFIHASEGGPLSRWLLRTGRTLRGLPEPIAAVGMGSLAALLPCGLFWGALGLATATRSALGGAEVLAAFAFGTLPALIFAAALLRRLAQRARRAVALATLLVGLCAIAHRAGVLSLPGDGAICDTAHPPSEGP